MRELKRAAVGSLADRLSGLIATLIVLVWFAG